MKLLNLNVKSWLIKVGIALCFILLLNACAEVEHKTEPTPTANTEDPLTLTNLDSLIEFGGILAHQSSGERAKQCRLLLERQKQKPSIGIQLRLVMGRLLSDACGNIPKILEGIDAVSDEIHSDERVLQWLSFHTETLRKIQGIGKKMAGLDRKKNVKNTIPAKVSKKASNLNTRSDGEIQLLREKLEAIKAMEKDLDDAKPNQ